jgi:hypothetical protein
MCLWVPRVWDLRMSVLARSRGQITDTNKDYDRKSSAENESGSESQGAWRQN